MAYTTGDQVIWLYTPNRKTELEEITGKVTKSALVRVEIEIRGEDGVTIKRWVNPAELSPTGFAYCGSCGKLVNLESMSPNRDHQRVCVECHFRGY